MISMGDPFRGSLHKIKKHRFKLNGEWLLSFERTFFVNVGHVYVSDGLSVETTFDASFEHFDW